MPDQDEDIWGHIDGPSRQSRPGLGRNGLIATVLSMAARALEAEADRWFLWLPVLFAGGILTYFALHNEPSRASRSHSSWLPPGFV